ncbi:MAG TPA: hypothetical protein VGL58_15430 [Caulobacteraceae bacterium]|jgi:hypothetical protein
MDWRVPLLSVLGAWSAWNLWRGLKTGKMKGRFGDDIDREIIPLFFWISAFVYAAVVLVSIWVLGATLAALLRTGR